MLRPAHRMRRIGRAHLPGDEPVEQQCGSRRLLLDDRLLEILTEPANASARCRPARRCPCADRTRRRNTSSHAGKRRGLFLLSMVTAKNSLMNWTDFVEAMDPNAPGAT